MKRVQCVENYTKRKCNTVKPHKYIIVDISIFGRLFNTIVYKYKKKKYIKIDSYVT